jgi:hypothetical protein
MPEKVKSSIWQLFFRTLFASLHLTTFQLTAITPVMIYTESLICEEGEVVGKTATVDVEGGRVSKTTGKLPFGYVILQHFSCLFLQCEAFIQTQV